MLACKGIFTTTTKDGARASGVTRVRVTARFTLRGILLLFRERKEKLTLTRILPDKTNSCAGRYSKNIYKEDEAINDERT